MDLVTASRVTRTLRLLAVPDNLRYLAAVAACNEGASDLHATHARVAESLGEADSSADALLRILAGAGLLEPCEPEGKPPHYHMNQFRIREAAAALLALCPPEGADEPARPEPPADAKPAAVYVMTLTGGPALRDMVDAMDRLRDAANAMGSRWG